MWHSTPGTALPFHCGPANLDKLLLDVDLVTVAK